MRVDTADYSVDPRMIGRFVDATASPDQVVVSCQGRVVAEHGRSWSKQTVIIGVDLHYRSRCRRLGTHGV